jgi:penicillin-binding protein 1A
VFNDAPISIGNWRPNNYDDKYYGRVPLHEAFARSLNSVAAQLAEKAGVQRVVEVAHRLGITSELRPDLSLALGTSEVSLLELTAAYGGFANAGRGVWPYGIVEIRDRDGHLLYRRTGSGPGEVMTPREAATMDQMMSEVLAYGTGKGAALGRPAAGKTGTTQEYRDAWFIGFTPDLIAGVWVGNDDGSPMKKVTGGRVPAHMWHDFMVAALAETPPHPFAEPPSLFEQMLQSLLGGSTGHRTAAASRPPAPARGPTDTLILPNGAYKTSQ